MSKEAEQFELQQRQARMFALSPLVPEHLRKGGEQQALANCYIALKLAEIMGEAPLIVMQNMHVVSGKAGFDTKYMIARANQSGIFDGRIDWVVDRSNAQNLSITAFAVLKDNGARIEFTCDMAMATAEGWIRNPKYKSMPELMLRYRSAALLIRLYAPEVMLGYHTAEELVDVAGASAVIDAVPQQRLTRAALQSHGTQEPEQVETVDAETGEIADEAGTEPIEDDESESDPHIAQAVADKFIEEARKCPTIAALDALETVASIDIPAMPEEMAMQVEAAFNARRDELTPAE
jgi:hypothetical protein